MTSIGWRFDHSYARLPEAMFARVAPSRARAPRLVVFNRALAQSLEHAHIPIGDAEMFTRTGHRPCPLVALHPRVLKTTT